MMRAIRRRVRPRGDDGMTLIEMLVSMALFSILIAVFMAGIAAMTNITVRTQASSDSSDEVRRAFQRLDKQIRYASAVNWPGVVGGNEYIEFLTTAVTLGEDPLCTQYKLDTTTDTLAFRTWPDVAGASASAWTVISSRVRNDPATAPVFALEPTDGNHNKQRVTVFLDVQNSLGDGAELRSTFVALNTTPITQTNAVDGSGNTVDPVCTQVARS